MSATFRFLFIFAFVFFSLASSASFTEAETVSAPSSVAAGSMFKVNWTAPSWHSTLDWVSIFAIGAPNTSYNSWAYVPAGSSGSVNIYAIGSNGNPLPSGNYEVRYLLDNFFTEPSPPARVSITVTGGTTSTGFCGDAICNNGETNASCPWDCPSTSTGFCGDAICNNGETSASCPGDCGSGGTTTTIPPPSLFFSAKPSVLSAGEGTTLQWSASNASSCSAASSNGSWSGSKPTAGSATFANMAQGTYKYTLTCQGNDGSKISSDAQVFVGPAPIPVVFFSATPSSLAAGGNTTLSWSSENAVSCTGSGNASWGGQNPKPTSGTITFTDLQFTTTYSITCVNKTGQSSPVQSQTVAVGPTLSFGVSPAVIDYGAKTLLSWVASPNVTSCSPNGFTASIALPVGSTLVTPQKSATYGLTCTGSDTSFPPVAKTTFVAVKPVFLKFDINPTTVKTLESSTFTWQVSPNAVSCEASGDWVASGLPISGTKVFSNLLETQRFTFSCMTSDNLVVSQTEQIEVIPVPVITSFSANPTSVTSDKTVVTLSWAVINAVSCTVGGIPSGTMEGGASSVGNTLGVSGFDTNTNIYLVCTGNTGTTASKSISITVTLPNAPALTFTADKTTIDPGESIALTWTVADASRCIADGASGWTGLVNSAEGTHSRSVSGIVNSTTLSLTCFGMSEATVPTKKTISITVNRSSLPLCSGVGKCKLSTDTCNGTKEATSDCTGGTICCVASGSAPSSGQWVTSPTSDGTGLLINLIGSTILGSLQAVADGSGWQITSGGSGSTAPVLNGTGDLQIVQNPDGSWQISPAPGSTSTVSGATFTSNGTGGWNVAPVTGTTSTGIGTAKCTAGCLPGSCSAGSHPDGTCASGTTCCVLDTTSPPPSGGSGTKVGGGLVPCGNQDDSSAAENCQFEDFMTLAKNVMDFLLFTIAVPLAAISFAWAGWLYMSAAGNESKVQEAHQIFKYVVLGLCIALAAWLIVNAVVVGLGVKPAYNALTGGTFGG